VCASRRDPAASTLFDVAGRMRPPLNPSQRQEVLMSNHTYKMIELVGSSSTSIDDAVQNAIAKAGKTMRNIHWFQVTETRGTVAGDKISQWQVTLKIGFTLED
jgi:flavin-binding protein dodecin